MTALRVLDVYAGRGGLHKGFLQRGHDVVSLDNDEEGPFGCTLTMDAMAFAEDPLRHLRTVRPDGWLPDVILGGPPCNNFSVLQIGRHWHPPPTHAPKTPEARLAVRLVEAFLAIVQAIQAERARVGLPPAWWWMENPRAKLRKLRVGKGMRRATITYCQYAEPGELRSQKPTDLWGNWPPSWKPRPACKPMAACHVAAPAGSRTPGSVQGTTGPGASALRAEAPLSLSLYPSQSHVRTPRRRPAPSARGG